MEQYINKAAVVAGIEEKLQDLIASKKDAVYAEERVISRAKIDMCKEILSFLNTIEVKEVDEEAMKNVVLETRVMKDSDGDGIDTPYEEWLTLEDTEIPFIPDNIGLKDGDKVKVIIIKQ